MEIVIISIGLIVSVLVAHFIFLGYVIHKEQNNPSRLIVDSIERKEPDGLD